MAKIHKNEYEKVPVNEKGNEPETIPPRPGGLGARHVQALLAFMCMSVSLFARAHPSVTVVAMLDPSMPDHTPTTTTNATITKLIDADHNITDPPLNHVAGSAWHVYRKYRWDKRTQEIVLGAFFAGYALAMWPMGVLVQRLGGKRPLQLGLLCSGLIALATPSLAALGGWKAVAASRLVTGLFQSGTYPSAMALVARWVPAEERASLGTLVFSGAIIGVVLALQLGGVLAASAWGWPASFWLSGGLCMAACCLFTAAGYKDPTDHPTISSAERRYITRVNTDRHAHHQKLPSTPWRRLLSSPRVWAAFIAQLGSSFIYMFVFSQAPSYLHFILGINVKSSGLLSSVPYAANFIVTTVISNLSEYCTNRGLCSVRNARIICNSIGSCGSALCLVAMSLTAHADLAVTMLVMSMALHGAQSTGWLVNYMDLSPAYSGALMATGNTVTNVAVMALPLFITLTLTDVYNRMQWRVVILIVSGISVLANGVFVTLMSADEEAWAHSGVQQTARQGPAFGERHKQCLMLFFALMVAYSIRACMAVALVAMSDPRADLDHGTEHGAMANNTTLIHSLAGNVSVASVAVNVSRWEEQNVTDSLSGSETGGFETHGVMNALLFTPPYPKFWWSKKVQDTILSSFFWGYMTLQLPGGWLSHRYGARRLLVAALAINAVLSFVLPWAAYYGGWLSTVLCRVLQGLSQACVVPSLHMFLGKWSPLQERSRMVGFVYGGHALGTVLGLPLTGFIASSGAGWPGVFRLYGLLAGAAAVAVCLMLHDTPHTHPRISLGEREYIERGLQANNSGKHLPVPWRRILTSRAVAAIALGHVAQTYGQLTLFTELPAYMDRVMGVSIKANGLLMALPFLVMFFTNFFFTWITDRIINKQYLSVTNARKLANSFGCLVPALLLVALAYAPHSLWVVESILVLICAFKIASNAGFVTNNVDLSPNFAGTIASVSNFVSNVVGSQAPIVASFIVSDPTSELQWRWVFFLCAGLYVMSNTMYLWLGTAERAEWDAPAAPCDAPAGPDAPLTANSAQWSNRGVRKSIVSVSSLPGDPIV